MKFTFGIITTTGNEARVNTFIDSVEAENIPEYEIIVIGNVNISRKNTIVNIFNENIKRGWITKKKNMITQLAKYENIVYLHDYFIIIPGWYQGFLKYGNDFQLCMNPILNSDNSRFRDWSLWWEDMKDIMPEIEQRREYLLPYDVIHLSRFMYFSGSYWVAKKNVMLEFPLDERLGWSEGEDVVWSKQVRKKYDFSININSIVKINKEWKDPVFNIMKDDLKAKILLLK